jgi:hypothetical protein
MTTSYSSESRTEYKHTVTRGKYLQPLDKKEREERLNESNKKIGSIQTWLNDTWNKKDVHYPHNADRNGMIEQVVDDLVWFDDVNHREWIHTKIIESELFKNWDGTEDDINCLINKYAKNKDEYNHYSAYREYLYQDTIQVIWPDGTDVKQKQQATDQDDDSSENGPKEQKPRSSVSGMNPIGKGIQDPDKMKNLRGDM